MGGIGPQQVPEQNGLQLLRRDGGIFDDGRNFQCVTGGGGVHHGLRLDHVEFRAGLLGNDAPGGGVIPGVFHFAGDLIVDLLGGHGLSALRGIGCVQREIAVPAAILQLLRQLFRVDGPTILCHMDQQGGILHLIGGVLTGIGEGICRGLSRRKGLLRVRGNHVRGVTGGAGIGQVSPTEREKAALQIFLIGALRKS
ncbi:hypothetical protein SDC9_97537 [bioreactor metagenome]|uniref:Uncharacterized protein n=1 Tax=bioreactor metagenome TaxID=1076179 RepID=A0A645AME3_9ZZZZ